MPTDGEKPKINPDLYSLQGEELAFYQKVTGIQDEEELKAHILDVQSRAYELYGYPCIRRFAFLRLKIARIPYYKYALKLLETRKNPILLDIGCCFGNDLRKAVLDGWPVQNVIASDLRQGFWDYGHELFKSTPESFPAAFVAGDAFDDSFLAPGSIDEIVDAKAETGTATPSLHSVTSLNDLRGKVSAIHASSFFHLFNEEQQLELARRLAALLSPEPGSVIFGQHGAYTEKKTRTRTTPGGNWSMFCHSPESWGQLWLDDVFGGARDKIKVEGRLLPVERADLQLSEDVKFYVLNWCITRI